MNSKKELKKLKENYKLLKEEIDKIKLAYNYDEGFSNSNDFDSFVKDNKAKLKEANELLERIKSIEWELMSPEERKKIEEQRRLSKLKREGKLF